jgi:hypothetical protein
MGVVDDLVQARTGEVFIDFPALFWSHCLPAHGHWLGFPYAARPSPLTGADLTAPGSAIKEDVLSYGAAGPVRRFSVRKRDQRIQVFHVSVKR